MRVKPTVITLDMPSDEPISSQNARVSSETEASGDEEIEDPVTKKKQKHVTVVNVESPVPAKKLNGHSAEVIGKRLTVPGTGKGSLCYLIS